MQFTALQLAQTVKGHVEGNPETVVSGISKLDDSQPGTLSFLSNPAYTSFIYSTRASIVLVADTFKPEQALPSECTLIRVENPYLAFAQLMSMYDAMQKPTFEIHPSASIDASAECATEIYLGPFVVLGKNVKIGKGSRIYAHTVIGDHVQIGENTTIFSNVTVYHHCTIGSDCTIHANTVTVNTAIVGTNAQLNVASNLNITGNLNVSGFANITLNEIVTGSITANALYGQANTQIAQEISDSANATVGTALAFSIALG